MKETSFDSYIAAAMEYDIFAGGDDSLPKNQRYTSQAAAQQDQRAEAQKNAVDSGQTTQTNPPTNQPGQQDQGQQPQDQGAQGEQDPNAAQAGGDDADLGDAGDLGGDADLDGEEGGDDLGAGGDDAASGDDMGFDQSTEDQNNPEEQLKKARTKTLFQITTSLHGGITANLELMNQMNPPSTQEGVDTFYNIQRQLLHCKDILYKIAVHDIGTAEYVDTLRRIMAVFKVYDLCIEALNVLYPKSKEKKKKKK